MNKATRRWRIRWLDHGARSDFQRAETAAQAAEQWRRTRNKYAQVPLEPFAVELFKGGVEAVDVHTTQAIALDVQQAMRGLFSCRIHPRRISCEGELLPIWITITRELVQHVRQADKEWT